MDKTDHDILVELARDVCWLKKLMTNHLDHHEQLETNFVKYHRAVYIAIVTAIAIVVGTGVITIVLK